MNTYEIDYAEKSGMYEDEAQETLNEEFYEAYEEVIYLSDELTQLVQTMQRINTTEIETWQETSDFLPRYLKIKKEVEEILEEIEDFLDETYEENYQI